MHAGGGSALLCAVASDLPKPLGLACYRLPYYVGTYLPPMGGEGTGGIFSSLPYLRYCVLDPAHQLATQGTVVGRFLSLLGPLCAVTFHRDFSLRTASHCHLAQCMRPASWTGPPARSGLRSTPLASPGIAHYPPAYSIHGENNAPRLDLDSPGSMLSGLRAGSWPRLLALALVSCAGPASCPWCCPWPLSMSSPQRPTAHD